MVFFLEHSGGTGPMRLYSDRGLAELHEFAAAARISPRGFRPGLAFPWYETGWRNEDAAVSAGAVRLGAEMFAKLRGELMSKYARRKK